MRFFRDGTVSYMRTNGYCRRFDAAMALRDCKQNPQNVFVSAPQLARLTRLVRELETLAAQVFMRDDGGVS